MRLFSKSGSVDMVPNAYVWARILPSLNVRRSPLMAKSDYLYDLQYINNFVNRRLRTSTDSRLWGKDEYWPTVDEIMSKRAGDCEDFAILKLSGLHDMGYSLNDFCVAVVRDEKRQGHAVLAYINSSVPLILDNRYDRVYRDVEVNYDPAYGYGYKQNWRFT